MRTIPMSTTLSPEETSTGAVAFLMSPTCCPIINEWLIVFHQLCDSSKRQNNWLLPFIPSTGTDITISMFNCNIFTCFGLDETLFYKSLTQWNIKEINRKNNLTWDRWQVITPKVAATSVVPKQYKKTWMEMEAVVLWDKSSCGGTLKAWISESCLTPPQYCVEGWEGGGRWVIYYDLCPPSASVTMKSHLS